MAATTARSPARAIIGLVDLLPNRRTSTIPSEESLLSAANLIEISMTGGFGTGRFPTAAATRALRQTKPRLDQSSSAPVELCARTETRPMDRPIEKTVM